MENNWSEVELNLYGLVAGREGGVLLANIYSEACSIRFLEISDVPLGCPRSHENYVLNKK